MKRAVTLICLLLLYATVIEAQPEKKISLNGSWKLAYWEQPQQAVTSPDGMKNVSVKEIAAQVPGNVELDLLTAGLVKDPMIGSNVYDFRKWEDYQWCYTKVFQAPKLEEGQRYQLFFGGIDCIADIWLNGKNIGHAADMMIEHAFDVTDAVVTGENKLQVIIRSSLLEGQNHLLGTFSIGNSPSPETIFVRKAPHMFGWDILPRLVSAGLWRDVELRVQNPTRITDVQYMVTKLDTTSRDAQIYAYVQIKIPFEKLDKTKAVFTLSRNGKEVYKGSVPVVYTAFRQIIDLKHVDLWWPRGYGEPALYDAKVELTDEKGNLLASDTKRIGIRTIQLDRNDINLPEDPGRFCFIVNGEKIFIHGTNWVPLDALHSRDKQWVDSAVDMAADLNCNMIRCWGGNVIEDHRFFDLCDEKGIMVWQDFTMGCNFYPQRREFTDPLEKEIISIVCKLRNHASLVLWSGNNEDDYALHRSLPSFDIDPNKDVVSRQVIPQVIYEFDPTRPYLPSSPYHSEAIHQRGTDYKYMPENHLWGPRGYYKTPFYTEAACVFVSEIGYHGCPNLESLKKMMTPDCVYPWEKNLEWNEEWLTKSIRRFPVLGKTFDRNNLMINQQKLLFGSVATKMEDFIFASQSVQAEAMKYFIEMWRGKKFEDKTGIIWWNLKDGWPVISDAIVDYYNSKKMAYYFIKNVQLDVCVLINDAVNGSYPLIAVNDTRNATDGEVKVTDVASGRQVFAGKFHIDANGKTKIASLPEMSGQGILLINYKVGGKDYANHYLYGKAPFKLSEYKELLKKTKIYNIK
jgi:beta-mannosidase